MANMAFQKRLAAIKARASKAIKGRWQYVKKDPRYCGMFYWPAEGGTESSDPPSNEATNHFIAHAREDVPWLVTELERIYREHEAMKAALVTMRKYGAWPDLDISGNKQPS